MEQFLEYLIVIWDLKNNPNTTNEAHVIFLKKEKHFDLQRSISTWAFIIIPPILACVQAPLPTKTSAIRPPEIHFNLNASFFFFISIMQQ